MQCCAFVSFHSLCFSWPLFSKCSCEGRAKSTSGIKKTTLTSLLHRVTAALSRKWLHSISYRRGNSPFCLGFCGIPDHRIDVAWQTKCSVNCWSFKLRCNCLGKKVWSSWPQPAVFQTTETPTIGNSSLRTLFLLGQRVKIKSMNGLIHSKRFLWQKILLWQKVFRKKSVGLVRVSVFSWTWQKEGKD